MSICNDLYESVLKKLDSILELRDKKILKHDGSYVTEGDLLCQKLLLEKINSLKEKFVVISEEIPFEKFNYDETKNYIVIDPIDGTENFVSGLKEWGISICIYRHGKHYESMLALPELNLKLISGEKIKKYSSRIYGLSSSLTTEDLLILKKGFEYRIIGCAVYNLYNVIRGSYCVFENFKGANSWDILAGLNLALEHSLSVKINYKEYNGEFLSPDRKYRFKISN